MTKYLIVLLAAAVLIHGFFAGSLLVRCIPAGGLSVLEVFGHDPHAFSKPCTPFGSLAVPDSGCIDLSLESSAILNAATGLGYLNPHPEFPGAASAPAAPSAAFPGREGSRESPGGFALRI